MAISYSKTDANKECQMAGDYEATLAGYEEKVSKQSQKPMMVLNWKCFTPEGNEFFLKDFIVIPDGVWKVKKIAQALDKLKEFEAEIFQPEEEIGCSLVLSVGVQVDKTGQYGDQNNVKAYKALERKSSKPGVMSAALQAQLKRAEKEDGQPVFQTSKAIDDDCPF